MSAGTHVHETEHIPDEEDATYNALVQAIETYCWSHGESKLDSFVLGMQVDTGECPEGGRHYAFAITFKGNPVERTGLAALISDSLRG